MGGRLALIGIHLKQTLAYRLDIMIWLLNPALQLILLATVWRAVYDGRSEVDGVTLSVMTTYVSMSTMHVLLVRDNTINWVQQRVRSGVIAMDLLRPIGLLEQQLWGQVGFLIMKVPMMLAILPVAVVFSGVTAPVATGPYLLAALLGWLVNCCVFLLIAVVAFWTLELGGMTFLFYVIGSFMSGGLVPLWFMPDWLRVTLEWLPLQATVYTPVAIYVGQMAGAAAWRGIAVQALWLVLLGAAVYAVWSRAVRRVVVQGG